MHFAPRAKPLYASGVAVSPPVIKSSRKQPIRNLLVPLVLLSFCNPITFSMNRNAPRTCLLSRALGQRSKPVVFLELVVRPSKKRCRKGKSLHITLHIGPVRFARNCCWQPQSCLPHTRQIPLITVGKTVFLVSNHCHYKKHRPARQSHFWDKHMDVIGCKEWSVLIERETN